MRRGGSGVLVVSLLLAACSAPTQQPLHATADSAGVRLVRIRNLAGVAFPLWTSEPVYSTEAHDSLRLGPMVEAGLTPDTSLIVTAGPELAVLDPHGRLQRPLGRNGNGPGEFRSTFRFGLVADGTVFASDFGSGRITQLRTTGEVVRILPRLWRSNAAIEVDPITMLPDGRILATYWQRRPNRGTTPGIPLGPVERDSAPLIVYDTLGRAGDRLGLWFGLERVRVGLGDEISRLPIRFARSAVYDGRGRWTAIGSTDSLDLSLFDGTALVLRLIAAPPTERPTSEMAAAWERTVLAEAPDVGAAYLRAIASAAEADRLPAIGGLVVDDTGNLWVGSYEVGAINRRWRVFSRTGQPIGQLELPAFAHPFIPGQTELLDVSGDRLAVRRVGGNGEVIVEVRRIRRP